MVPILGTLDVPRVSNHVATIRCLIFEYEFGNATLVAYSSRRAHAVEETVDILLQPLGLF
jgi:hypothetical protein